MSTNNCNKEDFMEDLTTAMGLCGGTPDTDDSMSEDELFNPFLQYPPKASIWLPNTMYKHAAPNSAPSKSTGDAFVFQKGRSQEI